MAIQKATGTQYTVGSSTNVLYAAAGGSDDYAHGVEGIPISVTMELPSGGGQGFLKFIFKLLSFLLGNPKLFIGVSGFDPPPNKIQNIVEESWIGIKAMALAVDNKFRK